MSLPVPNLDDRSFQDLVDEAKRLIPTYCPEWTNHNLTDPGVALIELFAWMTELSLFRLNQVPDKFYTHMLNMLGFEPFPATAARTDLTFWLVDVVDEPVVVPAGTQVSTAGEIGAPRTFTTLGDLVITQPVLMASLVSPGPDAYVDVWDALRLANQAVICFPQTPTSPGDRFYLGFERPLAGNAIRMSIAANVEGIGVIPSKPPLRWEVWQGAGWIPATVYRDTTGGLNRDGQITLLVPPVHEPLTLGGQRAYWMRARVLEPEPGQPTYRTSPQIRQIRVDSIGGSVTSEHSSAAPREVLGTSTGKPDQVFQTRNTPVLTRMPGETVTVADGDVMTEWTEVPDFMESGPDDRHFVWNSTTGEIRFGPLIRYPDGTSRQHGGTPREGSLIAATAYRFGGGADGNVGPATLIDMRTSLPYVDRVENITSAIGGVDAETVDNAKRRGPHSLRAGGRAVTIEDFERLTSEADPAIARVRCLPPEITGKPIRLLIVPQIERPGELLELDDFALTDDMVTRVSDHLDERRILGTAIEIGTPYYQGVTIAALLTARPGRPVTLVRERALSTLYRYLNPLTGGPHGTGWPFDADLNAANVFQLLEAVEGVERVEEVLFFEHDLRNHERVGFGKELVKLERDSLFLAANHQVVVR
ncbi:MAG: putative baseplate assembly protein [Ilumatobacteraceae bacterium]